VTATHMPHQRTEPGDETTPKPDPRTLILDLARRTHQRVVAADSQPGHLTAEREQALTPLREAVAALDVTASPEAFTRQVNRVITAWFGALLALSELNRRKATAERYLARGGAA
jgi:hypothetical protein